MEANKIYWTFVDWTGDGEFTARIEGEKYGKYYTATCQWLDGAPEEVADIEEIPEEELFNREKNLTKATI